jgi:hypothetical protein
MVARALIVIANVGSIGVTVYYIGALGMPWQSRTDTMTEFAIVSNIWHNSYSSRLLVLSSTKTTVTTVLMQQDRVPHSSQAVVEIPSISDHGCWCAYITCRHWP